MRKVYIAVAAAVVLLVGVNALPFVLKNNDTIVPQPKTQPVSALPAPITPTPAEMVISGLAEIIISESSLGQVQTDNPADIPVGVCGSGTTSWVTASASSASASGQSVSVVVSAWRAGAGTGAYKTLLGDARKCADVTDNNRVDKYTAVIATSPALRAQTVVRRGDVLTVITASSLDGNVNDLLDKAANASSKELDKRLPSVCANPTSTPSPQDLSRDPYSGKYKGKTATNTTSLPVLAPFTKTTLSELTKLKTDATWQIPPFTPRTDLAPVNKPDGTTPLAQAGRGSAPVLLDLNNLTPPSGLEPSDKPAKPTLPDQPSATAVSYIPVVDTAGPGCGWSFTQVNAPVINLTDLQSTSTRITLDAVIAATQSQEEWLTATVAWASAQRNWATAQTQWNNWQKYRATIEKAQQDLKYAKEQYAKSLDAWAKPYTAPTAKPTPTPSNSPTPTPSNSPTPTPKPSGA